MAKKKAAAVTAEAKEELKKTIAPEEIIMDDDSDMPEPQTKVYRKYLKCTKKFLTLLDECLSSLPYTTMLKNESNETMRAVDLLKFVENNHAKITIDDMNKIISYIAGLDIKHARPLMTVVEQKDKQSELWSLVEE